MRYVCVCLQFAMRLGFLLFFPIHCMAGSPSSLSFLESCFDFFMENSCLPPQEQERINAKVIMELEQIGTVLIKYDSMETDAIQSERGFYGILSIEKNSISLSISEKHAKKTKNCSNMIWCCAVSCGESMQGEWEESMHSVFERFSHFFSLSTSSGDTIFYLYLPSTAKNYRKR